MLKTGGSLQILRENTLNNKNLVQLIFDTRTSIFFLASYFPFLPHVTIICLHHLGLMSTADMERKAHSAKDYMFRQVAQSVPAENKAIIG